jgi:thiamine biosynthesis lipoprotein
VTVAGVEAIETFACFGGDVTVIVMGRGPAGSPGEAVAAVKHRMLEWHQQFSRFEPDSELSRLNADRRETVPVSPVMARFVDALLGAAVATGGLVDATLVGEIEAAGYATHFDGEPVPLAQALDLAPQRKPGGPSAAARWRALSVDRGAGTVTRPPGLSLDSGGIAKGLFCDILAGVLDGHQAYAIDCAGDVRLGGRDALQRPVQVAGPFTDAILHTFSLQAGAVATSGVSKRSWLDHDGRPAHHLLDPASGRPAYTGIVQASAIAPSGVEAEWRAKAALLSGPSAASDWLTHGGLVVFDDASFELSPVTLR